MESNARPAGAIDQDLGFADLPRILWKSRGLILAITTFTTVAALGAALLLPKKYEAQVLLLPVTEQAGAEGLGNLGGAASPLGGLAALAGLSVSGGGERAEAIATLQSDALTREYIRETKLLPVLFGDQWNATTSAWKGDRPPSEWMGNDLFKKKIRRVVENAKTGLVTLSVRWRDAELASKWANDLAVKTNEFLREKAIEESKRNVIFLNEQLGKTNVIEVRNAIYSLLESEIKREMLARGSDSYALKIVDPATVPEKPSFPLPPLWTLAGFLGGVALSTFLALLRRPSVAT